MLRNFNPGMIGIGGLDLAGTVAMARQIGFDSVDFSIQEAAGLVDAHGLSYVQDLFAVAGVRPGQWSLSVSWRDEAKWRDDVAALPRFAALGQALGCTRTATWCPPGSDTLTYEQNFQWHADRFRPIAAALLSGGCRLGLEFIGPKTLRDHFKYPFIYTLGELMELAAAIGTGNVGLLLDAYHLYTSGASVDDLDQVTAQDVVLVHINDAPAGVPRDEQLDQVRCLPMETGVVDLPNLLRKLAAMGYDGPVTTEPFYQPIRDIAAEDPTRAASIVLERMNQAWRAAGLL